MVTRDVLKVLKLHSPTARAILRAFKTSLVPINHEMHSRSYDFLYLMAHCPDVLADKPHPQFLRKIVSKKGQLIHQSLKYICMNNYYAGSYITTKEFN